MQRTQIYFPESLHQDLKIGAAAMEVSLSEYIRIILEKELYVEPAKSLPRKKRQDLL